MSLMLATVINQWLFQMLSDTPDLPPGSNFLITENGNFLITEAGDNLITE